MTTITDIRNDLINVFNSLRAGTMEAKEAVEINNTAGKIISSAKVQLAYAALRGEKPDIPFLLGEPELVAPKIEARVFSESPSENTIRQNTAKFPSATLTLNGRVSE